MAVPPAKRDMIFRADKKLTGIARTVEKRVAIRPIAIVSIMVPATNVLTLLPVSAKPRATRNLEAGMGFTVPTISKRFLLGRITPSVGCPASLSLIYEYMHFHAQIWSSPLIDIVMASGFRRLVATMRASLKRSTRRPSLIPVTCQAIT